MPAELRVCSLYPDLMNIYADRGNMLMLERRCAWRGIGFRLDAAGLGDSVDPEAHDLFYIGGGQDRDQALCARDLATVKRDALHAAADAGKVVLAVCGGYQLLGSSYELGDEELPGVGLVDLHTVREAGPRLIGNVAIEVELNGEPAVLAGFENHGGRTYLGPTARPLGRVLSGHGNNDHDGFEGVAAQRDRHLPARPAVPKNAHFADWLIATALGLERLEGLGPRRAGGRRPRAPEALRARQGSDLSLGAAQVGGVGLCLRPAQRPLEPKPPSPRALASSAATATGSGRSTRTTRSCATRSPGLTAKRSAASVLSSSTRSSPR